MGLIVAHLITFASLLCTTMAARILGIFPPSAQSHFNYNHAILKTLHEAGHEITMITPIIPSEKKIENFTYIDCHFNRPSLVGQFTTSDVEGITLSGLMDMTIATSVAQCYDVIKLPQIQQVMKSGAKLYDIMLIELFMDHSCYLPIAERLQIPVIGTKTLRLWQIADHVVGAPYNPAILPVVLASCVSKINLVGRAQNLWNYLIVEHSYTKMREEIDKFYLEHFSDHLLHKKDVSLVFYNSHPTITPRPISANVIEVGGIHVKPAKPLPAKLKTFIDEAPHGVILFTFGSIVLGSSMTPTQREAFISAFATIPQRVIWKHEKSIANVPKNVMLLDWLPQRDILQHKNVIAFMSHCGQSGMYEAIATGTPVVTVPLFADQPVNAAALQHLGVGVDLKLETVTKDTVLAALNAIINDTSYYRRSQELSRVFKDRPMTPDELIVYWTEYVIRHNGAPYLRALGSDVPFYAYFMLDIIALGLLSLGLVILVIYWIVKRLMFFSITDRKKVVAKKYE